MHPGTTAPGGPSASWETGWERWAGPPSTPLLVGLGCAPEPGNVPPAPALLYFDFFFPRRKQLSRVYKRWEIGEGGCQLLTGLRRETKSREEEGREERKWACEGEHGHVRETKGLEKKRQRVSESERECETEQASLAGAGR